MATVVQSAVQSYWRWWRSDEFQHMHGPEYQVGLISSASGPSHAAGTQCLMGRWGITEVLSSRIPQASRCHFQKQWLLVSGMQGLGVQLLSSKDAAGHRLPFKTGAYSCKPQLSCHVLLCLQLASSHLCLFEAQ